MGGGGRGGDWQSGGPAFMPLSLNTRWICNKVVPCLNPRPCYFLWSSGLPPPSEGFFHCINHVQAKYSDA